MPTSHVSEYLGWLAAGDASTGTLRLRRSQLSHFDRHYPLLSATEADLAGWLAQPGLKRETRRSRKAALHGFYKWAQARGLVEQNPAALLHRIKPDDPLPHPISEHDLARAFALADAETALMLALGAYAGLRRAEIAATHADWVQPLGLMVVGKGGKVRRVPVHPQLRPRLSGLAGWAFPSPRIAGRHVTTTYIEDRLGAVLPAGNTPHSLRHRFATQAYQACRDITVVQRLLGHANVSTTMRYVRLVDDDLDAAVNAVA